MAKKLDAFNRAFSKRPYIALRYLCSVTLNGAPKLIIRMIRCTMVKVKEVISVCEIVG